MKVYELDDANLKIFLESVPEILIRDSFKKHTNKANRGYRNQKINGI